MNMDHVGRAEVAAPGVARFEYTPEAADYDRALRRFSLRTRPGLTGSLLLPGAFAAAAIFVRAVAWHLDETVVVISSVLGVIILFVVRQAYRRFRVRGQYETHAARGVCRTTLAEDGLTTTGTDGKSDRIEWSSYPWWFETSELFVLTGSLGYFLVLPKRGAASSEDLDRARALFVQHLRRI
ncbi:YcxB family protein [Streptomyces sp. LN704]|uniref:YcxB family protein n=1 Tax=unclassified Streptomyces TaxID=2593676 RepID=UPI0037123D9B